MPTMFSIEFDIKVICILCMFMEPNAGFTVYTVSDTISSWNNANLSCHLATPALIGKGMDKTADFEHPIDMVEGEEAWIGYLSEQAVLEYIGCVELNVRGGLQFSSPDAKTDTDLGQCSVACSNTTYFGVMLTECFCFDELPSGNTHESRCKTTCHTPKDEAVCGGGKFVSMYKHAEAMKHSNLTIQVLEVHRGSCIMFDQNKRQFLPSKCTTAYVHSCQNREGQFYRDYQSAKRWLDMANFCFGKSLIPFTYDIALKTEGYNQLWTGMVTTRKYFTSTEDSKDSVFAVYVVRQNGEYRLRYSNEMMNEKRKYVCQQDVITESTTLSTVPRTTEKTQPLKQSDDSDDLLVVYILVPILVVCILLAIIVCICIKRRKGRKGHLDIDNTFIYKNNGHVHNNDMVSEIDDLDNSITLKHVEEHHDELDYSNVPTLRVSDKGYTNGTLERTDHSDGSDNSMHGKCPEEEIEYSTIKKEQEKEANKNRESFDPTYDTTKAQNKADTKSEMNSMYDRANYDDPYVGDYSDDAEDPTDGDMNSGVVNQGLSRF